MKNTPKVVGGLTPAVHARGSPSTRQFIDTVVEAAGAKEAEMAKLIENTFRHVNIALVNEMVRFSHELGIDLWNAIDCATTKPFGFMAFSPGPGVGGHCIPVDPSYLSHRVKAKLGLRVPDGRAGRGDQHGRAAVRRQAAAGGAQRAPDGDERRQGAVLGVTYKADISDCRESPAYPLVERLRRWGARCPTTTHSCRRGGLRPVPATTLSSVADAYAAAGDVDAVILLQRTPSTTWTGSRVRARSSWTRVAPSAPATPSTASSERGSRRWRAKRAPRGRRTPAIERVGPAACGRSTACEASRRSSSWSTTPCWPCSSSRARTTVTAHRRPRRVAWPTGTSCIPHSAVDGQRPKC